MAEKSAFSAQLAILTEQYALHLRETLEKLSGRIENLGSGSIQSALPELIFELHKLSGSGSTFGFPELSGQARILEQAAQAWLDDGTDPDPVHWLHWKKGVCDLTEILVAREASGVLMPGPSAAIKEDRDGIQVILIEDDQTDGELLFKELRQFGYQVKWYTGFAEAEAAIRCEAPDILVVDIMLPGQIPSDGTEALSAMFDRLGVRVPAIFLTARKDFSARLAAAKAGGGAFLTKPVDVPAVTTHIEMLLQEQEHISYRVLIVDDDEILSEYYRQLMQTAGICAETVSRPQDVLEAMEHLNPDLLLMDLYMPECSGAELAKAIRYDSAWMGLPIVYLSAEDDLDEQIKALRSGADEFLTKPISDAQLIATVQTKAARARKVAELMSQDSLTGLLKHSNIKARLAQELDRARRLGTLLSVVMVDIDNFKEVNDRWGHPMGDKVIKSLAQLLRQCLRRQDSIGRYGGEEFVVILPECGTSDAVHLLDDIRKRFGSVHFIHEGQSFLVTLSAGVASNTHFNGPQAMLSAADSALYAAKHGGRNQVRSALKN